MSLISVNEIILFMTQTWNMKIHLFFIHSFLKIEVKST